MSIPTILTATAALENADAGLAALGFEHAFDTPPEHMFDLPVTVRFLEGAGQLHGSRLMGRYNLFEFKIELHLARGVLLESIANVLPYIEAFQNLYTGNLSISGTCDVSGFREPAFEGPVVLRYGADPELHIGIIFYMWAKEILDDITVDL